jgi:AcrR family transcriptional regulator
MTPRRYDMGKRAQARDDVRRQIVAATIELHTEHGILGTSYRQIAERADVAVATVYNHFPSLDELVPACGEMLMQRLRPPSPDDAATVIGDAVDTQDRLTRVADELFEFYERGGAHLDLFPGERDLPAMQEWEQYQRGTVEAFVRAALVDRRPPARTVRLVSALFDLSTFRALQGRGFDARTAAPTLARAAACLLDLPSEQVTARRR